MLDRRRVASRLLPFIYSLFPVPCSLFTRMPFVFPYDSLLEQRRVEERRRQRALAELLREEQRMKDRLAEMQTTVSRAKHEMATGLTGRVDLQAITGIARYAGQLRQTGLQAVRQTAAFGPKIEQARRQLAEAIRARRALELLRERRETVWNREQAKKEQIELDEAAAQMHRRQTLRTAEVTA